MSRYMMPILLVLVVVIAGYALTLRHEDASARCAPVWKVCATT